MHEFFKIFRLTPEEANKIAAAPDEPHNHDFEELVIGVEGAIEHFIDFKSTTIQAPFVSFISRGKMHRIIPLAVNGQCDAWVMRFKSEFIPETTFQLYAYYHDRANIALLNNECFSRLPLICSIMHAEMQRAQPDLGVIRHLLSALFTMIESERKKSNAGDEVIQKTQSVTFQNFLRILEENFRRPEGVEFYAQKLFMSSRNLNLICQSIMQQSVSELIETRKLIEAKNLLTSTDKSISEIGYELGYKEKAYFTSVFKKNRVKHQRSSGKKPAVYCIERLHIS